jgi:DNA-binding FadR family transcriptional regulator
MTSPRYGKAGKSNARGSASPIGEQRRDEGELALPPIVVGRKLYAQVAETLGCEIVGGIYAPGEALPGVPEMCARFEVSRTALREAYSILAAKGLISARPKVGTLVRPRAEWNALDPEVLAWHFQSAMTEKVIRDLFKVRQMIEPAAAAMAAEERSSTTLTRLEEAFARMVRYRNGEGDLIAADLDFHMAILEGQDNLFLSALGGLIHTSLRAVFSYSWEGAARIQEERLRGHEAILEAIREGRADEARRRMSALLSDSLDDVREFLRRRMRSTRPAPQPGG